MNAKRWLVLALAAQEVRVPVQVGMRLTANEVVDAVRCTTYHCRDRTQIRTMLRTTPLSQKEA